MVHNSLPIEVFIHGVEAVLELLFAQFATRIIGWIVIHIREKNSLAKWGFDMFPRAAVAVAAGSNLQQKLAMSYVRQKQACLVIK